MDVMKLLSNDVWGFASNCFACDHRNDAGLRIPVHHDVETQRVVADFELDDRFSGAPSYVHGGVVLAILDEAMAWATIALRSRFAVTTEFTSRFRRPVLIDQPHLVRATCGELAADGRTLKVSAAVTRVDGKVCVEAEGTYYAMTVAETAAASGVPELPDEMLRVFGTTS